MSTTTTQTATPAKLRDGSWGARCPGSPSIGDTITITTRAGKSWDASVTRIIWTGADKHGGGKVAICATASLDPSPRQASRYTRRGRAYYDGGVEIACGYPCPVSGRRCTPSDPCHDCA